MADYSWIFTLLIIGFTETIHAEDQFEKIPDSGGKIFSVGSYDSHNLISSRSRTAPNQQTNNKEYDIEVDQNYNFPYLLNRHSKREASDIDKEFSDFDWDDYDSTDDPLDNVSTTEGPLHYVSTSVVHSNNYSATDVPLNNDLTTEAPSNNDPLNNDLTTEAPSNNDLTTEAPSNNDLTTEALSKSDLTTEVLSNNDLTTEAPSNNDLTTEALSNNDLTTEVLSNNDLTTEVLSNNDLTTEVLSNNDLTTEVLSNNDLTTEVLSNNDLTTEVLSNNDLTTEVLSNNDLTTEVLSNNDLTTEVLSNNDLTTEVLSNNDLTTEVLSNNELTTEAPSNNDPSNNDPSNNHPSNKYPTTEAHSNKYPTTEAPSNNHPRTEVPSNHDPTTKVPSGNDSVISLRVPDLNESGRSFEDLGTFDSRRNVESPSEYVYYDELHEDLDRLEKRNGTNVAYDKNAKRHSQDPTSKTSNKGVMVLRSLQSVSVGIYQPTSGVVQMTSEVTSEGNILLAYSTFDKQTHVDLINTNLQVISIVRWNMTGPCHFMSPAPKLQLVACAFKSNPKSNEIQIFQLDLEHYSASLIQSLKDVYKLGGFESWKQEDRFLFLATESEKIRLDKTKTYETKSYLYRWNEKQFEAFQNLPGFSPRRPHHFQIKNNHFVVLPNFMNNGGNYNLHSEIYKFNSTLNAYLPFQSIPTYGATQVTSFKMGPQNFEENFLIVANSCKDDGEFCDPETNSTIYKFSPGGNFLHFQCIKTSGVTYWSTFQMDGQAVLMAMYVNSGLTFYQYQGWKFIKVVPHMPIALSRPGLTGIANFMSDGEPIIAVSSSVQSDIYLETLSFFKLKFTLQKPVEEATQFINRWCHKILASLSAKTEAVKRDQEKMLLKNRPLVLSDKKVIKFTMDSPSTVPVVDNKIYPKVEARILSAEAKLRNIDKKLDDVESAISKAINVNETIIWPDNLKFTTVVILAAKTKRLFTEFINEYEVPPTKDLIPIFDQNVQLDLQSKTFSEIKSEVVGLKNLNGYPITSYVTTNGNYDFTSHVTFGSLATPGVEVGGLIDGVNVTDRLLLLNRGDQEFTGTLTCGRLFTSRLQTDYINDVNVNLLIKDTAVNNSSVVLKGSLTILGDLIYPGNLELKTLSGKNLKKLRESVLLLKSNEKQIITGKYSISEARMNQLYIGHSLNGLQFPKSVFINLPEKVYHASKAHFTELSSKEVVVDKELNGLKVLDGQLDILKLRGDQQVSGFKSFRHIHLDDHNRLLVSSDSKIPVNADEWNAASKLVVQQRNRDQYTKLYELKEKMKSMKSQLKAYRIIKAYVVDLDSKKLSAQQTHLQLDSTSDDSDFYERVEKSLVNMFYHLKAISKFIENGNNDAVKALAHKDFAREDKRQLWQVADLSTIPLSLQRKLEKFYATVASTIVSIERRITNVKSEIELLDRILNSAEKYVNDEYYKRGLDSTHGSGGSQVAGLISGYNFEDLKTNLYGDADSSNLTIPAILNADRLIFLKNLVTPSLNNLNLEKLLNRAIPLSSPEVNVELNFKEDVVIQGNLDSPIVNGVEATSFATLSGTNVFERPLQFKSIRANEDVEVKGKVNNFHLKSRAANIALVSGSQNFKNKIAFGNVKTNSLSAETVLLGSSPIEDIVCRKDVNPVISGSKQFSSVTILNSTANIEDLRTEFLDGVNISESIENGRVAHYNVTISDSRRLSKLLVKGNVDVDGYIQSGAIPQKIYLRRLSQEVAYVDEENFLRGDFVFGGKVHVQELLFTDRFDGVSSEMFDRGFALKNQNQTVQGKNLFKNVRVKSLWVKSNTLQGANLSAIFNDSVKIDEDTQFSDQVFFGTLKSSKPIWVDGLVQGWNLTRDAVLKSKSASFLAPKSFSAPVKVMGDFDVKGLINGFDLERRCHEIVGTITVDGPVHFRRNLRTGRVSSSEFSVPDSEQKFWMTDQNTTLPSDLLFDWVTTNQLDVRNELNNELMNSILREPINCEDPIEGKWSFGSLSSTAITTNQITVSYLNNEDANILDSILVNGTHQEFKSNLKIEDVTVKESLLISGKVNGQKITNFCRKDQTCVISAPKKFMSVFNVQHNWDFAANSHINNLNVEDIKALDEIPPLNVVIEDSLQAPSINVEGYVNGITFDANTIMSLSANQTMKGSLLISSTGGTALRVKNARVLSNLYNGVDVTSLERFSMGMDEGGSSDDVERLMQKFSGLGSHISELRRTLKNQVVSFDGWEIVQRFESNIRITPLLNSMNMLNAVALISRHNVRIMNWAPFSNTYRDSEMSVNVNCTTDAKGFYKGNDLFIATSSNCPNDLDLTDIAKIRPEGISMEENVFSFLWKVAQKGPKLYAAVATTEASQVLIFKISGRNCMLFVSFRAPMQNMLCEDHGVFILQQSIPSVNAIKALHMTYMTKGGIENSLLIFGNAGSDQNNKLSSVKIFTYNPFNGHFDVLQDIHRERLVDLASSKFNQDLYLATVHHPFLDSIEGEINIYRVSENKSRNDPSVISLEFRWEEALLVDDPLQAAFIETPSKDLQLLVLNANGYVFRYKKSGYEKFRLDGVMYLPGKTHMETWNWHEEDIYNLALSDASFQSQSDRYLNTRSSGAIILKPKFKGWSDDYS